MFRTLTTGSVPCRFLVTSRRDRYAQNVWRFEIYKDEDKKWLWRLILRNTLIVVESSERFERQLDAKQAAETARVAISAAPVVIL